jgi:aminocarboxymuconate-semialdehyde decarboxylase
MSASLDVSRICNDRSKEAEKNYPGRFIATAAHAHALGGADHLRELNRCVHELGMQSVVITSEMDGKFIDDRALEPFWTEAERLGLIVFVHPALKLNHSEQFDAYDTARSVGREFSLVMATIRLINSGVFDRHPKLRVHMSHLGGGIAGMLARIRGYQDKEFWGVAQSPKHGRKAAKDFDHYIENHMIFDTAGFCCAVGAVKAGLAELPAARIVFATDYPQEVRRREHVRDFVADIKKLGEPGERILSGNVGLLLKK